MAFERIHDRMIGRWKSLLPLIGVSLEFLTGKHCPCPVCGGKDRFRFDDKGGNGTWFCSHCGAGNGVDLIMKAKGMTFIEAKREIEKHIGEASIVVPKATRGEAERDEQNRDRMVALWGRASCLSGNDIASRYLAGRGIQLEEWPIFLRAIEDLPYFDEDKNRTFHPAMLAKFVAADGQSAILHRTYLAEPGRKADLPKAKMLMPGKVPMGGAVRLFPAAETMGIAEGIETALSASILSGIPVWSALSTGPMTRWKPPKEAKCIIVFGDNDRSYEGQTAAISLAHRLTAEGLHVDVRFPDEKGCDWNDVLIAERPPSRERAA